MAVTKMLLLSITGQMNRLDDVISVCCDSGQFQPNDALSFFSDNAGDLTAVRGHNPYTATLNTLETAISRVHGKAVYQKPARFERREELEEYVRLAAGRSDTLSQRALEISSRLDMLRKEAEQFEHFRGLDVDMQDILDCETIKVRFGRLPKESFDRLELYDDNPYVLFFPGASDNHYYWGVYFAPLEVAPEVDRIFAGLYFERMRVPAEHGTPEEILAHLQSEIEEAQRAQADCADEMARFRETEGARLQDVYSQLKELDFRFGVRKFAAQYNDKFILAGWIPAEEQKNFEKRLDAVGEVEHSFERPGKDVRHTPPVKLKNGKLFRPFEFFVDMYGVPRYGEIDPTAFVAVTYTLLFGVMFGDVGQGLLVALIGWLMWKLKKMAIGRILVPCGISSAVFGLVFGSVFGFEHVLDPVYKALFGWEEKPIEVLQPDTTVLIIAASIVVGLVLILLSMVLNIYSGLRRRDFEGALFGPSGVCGLVFYAALIAGLAGQMLLGWHLLTVWYVLPLIVLPLLLMFFREPLGKLVAHDPDWKPEKWGEYIVQNIFEMFETMLSYLSNTMSFLRVAAFVLVHAGMMMAVFAIGDLFGPFGYTVAVVVGNALVMVMEALLVAIQVMRLEFYEMFSRYYQGDGWEFSPLSLTAERK